MVYVHYILHKSLTQIILNTDYDSKVKETVECVVHFFLLHYFNTIRFLRFVVWIHGHKKNFKEEM